MLTKNHIRRPAMTLLIGIILFAAMTHGDSVLTAAILIPVWFCFDTIISLADLALKNTLPFVCLQFYPFSLLVLRLLFS